MDGHRITRHGARNYSIIDRRCRLRALSR